MNRRLKLINWVRAQHEGQLIKETNAPYLDHVLAVANRVANAAPLTFEIGLCHDLLEKTAVTFTVLLEQLKGFGYNAEEAEHIGGCVTELTGILTKPKIRCRKRCAKLWRTNAWRKSAPMRKRSNTLIFLTTRIG